MRKANLCLHAGGHEVKFDDVLAVATPAATLTHFPLPHGDMINRVRTGLNAANLEIVNETHALSHGGARYFGILQVAPIGATDTDHALVMGVRNSHDKTFPAGILAGSQVFVCDNLAFSAEIKLARKHTVNCSRDLPGKITEGIGRLSSLWNTQTQRFETYKETDIASDVILHDLLFRSMLCGAATVTQLKSIYSEFKTPTHEDFKPRNVWSLFNAFTEVGKENSLRDVPARTYALQGLLDGFCGIVSKESASAVN